MVVPSVGASSLKVSYPTAPHPPNSLKTTGQQKQGKRQRGWVKKGRKKAGRVVG